MSRKIPEDNYESKARASPGGGAEGSRRRRCEARNTNDIAGSLPWDELAQHSEVP